jgi:hypothetical protein
VRIVRCWSRRGPSARPASGKDRRRKPMVKSCHQGLTATCKECAHKEGSGACRGFGAGARAHRTDEGGKRPSEATLEVRRCVSVFAASRQANRRRERGVCGSGLEVAHRWAGRRSDKWRAQLRSETETAIRPSGIAGRLGQPSPVTPAASWCVRLVSSPTIARTDGKGDGETGRSRRCIPDYQ